MNLSSIAITAFSLLVLGSACGSSGRIRSEGEEQLVGDKRAGTLTYDHLVRTTMEKLVANANMGARSQGKYNVAFFGIQTRGAEELKDQLPAIYQQVEEILVNSGPFTVLSRTAVDRAAKEIGLRDFEDLFIAKNREAFNGVMGRDSTAPDVLIYGTSTTQTSESSGGVFSRDTRERRYSLSMDMIDAHTGTILAKQSGSQEVEYKK